jgi:hypothetical protein
MRLVEIGILCPGCQARNPVSLKEPGFLELKVKKFLCGGCESRIMIKYERGEPGHLKIDRKLIDISQRLRKILRERLDAQLELGRKQSNVS